MTDRPGGCFGWRTTDAHGMHLCELPDDHPSPHVCTACGATRPVRLQLSRRAGTRLPEGAISVARPTRYGNPYIVATPTNGGNMSRADAVRNFERALKEGRLQFSVAEVKRDLRGHALACWCPLDAVCHADVLIRLSNG